MTKKRKDLNLRVLQIKRGALFLLGLTFFLFPAGNWYSSLQSKPELPKTREINPSIISSSDYPVNITHQEVPFLTARSVALVDHDSAVLIYGKNERARLLPASTVKIMTALVALDFYHLDDILVVNKANGWGQDMALVAGEMIRVENLLCGLLIASANDAASVLAQNYPGGEKNFVAEMNQKAKDLNLTDTYFANPTGLDSDEQGRLLPSYSYTTALDLARLASWALRNETLSEIVRVKEITVNDVSGKITHRLYNVNQLLGNLPGIKGIKTGWTEEAKECLVSLVERDGRGIVLVILGSQDRFGETAKMADWVFSNYRWEKLTPSIQN